MQVYENWLEKGQKIAFAVMETCASISPHWFLHVLDKLIWNIQRTNNSAFLIWTLGEYWKNGPLSKETFKRNHTSWCASLFEGIVVSIWKLDCLKKKIKSNWGNGHSASSFLKTVNLSDSWTYDCIWIFLVFLKDVSLSEAGLPTNEACNSNIKLNGLLSPF